MRHLRKIFSIIMVGVMLFGIINLTGCSFFKSKNESQGFSQIRLEKLEDTVDTVVEDYFMEKYGVEATVTYKNVAGGVFLGPDPSSVQYFHVIVNITEGDIVNEYYVEVHGRETEGIDELYVKSDAYYGQVIEERMEEWLSGYVDTANFEEYYVSFFSSKVDCFPGEYGVTSTAEEIIQSVSSIEDNKERPSLSLSVFIPESEYEKHSSIENEFNAIRNYLVELKSEIKIIVYICSNEEYEKNKADDDYRISPILKFEITGKDLGET